MRSPSAPEISSHRPCDHFLHLSRTYPIRGQYSKPIDSRSLRPTQMPLYRPGQYPVAGRYNRRRRQSDQDRGLARRHTDSRNALLTLCRSTVGDMIRDCIRHQYQRWVRTGTYWRRAAGGMSADHEPQSEQDVPVPAAAAQSRQPERREAVAQASLNRAVQKGDIVARRRR